MLHDAEEYAVVEIEEIEEIDYQAIIRDALQELSDFRGD